jgi:hypothetical protein
MAYRKPISPPESTCSEFLECALTNPDPVAVVLFVAAASIVLLFVTIALAHVTGARSLLDEERGRIADEAEAFEAFARRVADVDVETTPVADGGPAMTTAMETSQAGDGLEAVRDAYRETVMAVPHYEAEYDESLSTNMSLEFGEDVASAVARGSALTPQLKGTLVERSRTARRQRRALLRQLDGEAEALDEAETTLEHCRRSASRIEDTDLADCSFDELAAEWRLLEDRRVAAEALLEERQETVQERERETGSRPGGPSFEEYLYEPLDATYPVLAETTSLVERIESARSRVERALSSNA